MPLSVILQEPGQSILFISISMVLPLKLFNQNKLKLKFLTEDCWSMSDF